MTTLHRPRKIRRPKPSNLRRLCTLAILALCLASLATPLMPSASAEQGLLARDCPFLQHWDEELGKCVANELQPVDIDEPEETVVPEATQIVVEERDQPTEEPTEEPAPTVIPIDLDVTVVPNLVDTGTVMINKHRCPDGYDSAGKSIYDLAADCIESPDGILFGISDGASEIATGTTGSAFPGGFEVTGLPLGGTAIYEKNVPAGGTSVVFCDGYTPEEGGPSDFDDYYETTENQIFHDFGETPLLYCDWFNMLPAAPGSATLIINKIACPAGYDASAEDYYDLAFNCHDTADGIEFGVSDGASEIDTATTGSTGPGGLQIDNLPAAAAAIYEKNVPAGMASVVFCDGFTPEDNGPSNFVKMSQSEPNQIFHVFAENETLYCDWFNVTIQMGTPEATPEMGGYGDVTIYKWACPEGFDPALPGADPASACTTPLDGVTFTMERPGISPLQSNTGDSIPGAVYFGGQEAGDYTVTETLPFGYESAFVWNCTGASTDWVNPVPLMIGTTLALTVAGGDVITCNWYNVPESDPDMGDLTVYKYICSGPEFVSDIDCEIYEYGKTFDLRAWNGSAFETIDTQVSSASGTISWTGLPATLYQVDEVDGEPCHVEATELDAEGNVVVNAGQESVVKVYNCTAPGATPVAPKTPTKYPNTGVTQSEPAPMASQDTALDCPEIAEPNTGSNPESSDITEGTCPRGQVPTSLTIESIGVDAEVEILETVNGEMQAPTTAEVVSWYKETTRLGEAGNTVIAGHLNYWGVPEGIFFNLDDLQEGDVIVVTGPDGAEFRYEVVWSEQVAVDSSLDDVVGPTDVESLTLITCGGEWDDGASEYDHRTVVRAERID